MKRVSVHVSKNIFLLLGSVMLILLGYGLMLIPHYSIDSYYIVLDTMSMYRSGCKAGRLMFLVWAKLLMAWNINPVRQQWVATPLLILGCTVSCLLLYTAVRRYVCQQLRGRKAMMLFFSLVIAFCNPFMVEWFQFVEIAPIYSICLCLAVLSVVFVLRNKRWDWLAALLCLLVAVTGYQVVITIFLILSAVLLLIKYNYCPSWKVFWEMVRCVALTGTAGVTALLWAKWLPTLLETNPRFSDPSLLENLRFVRSIQSQVWIDTLGLLPKGLVMGFILLCMMLTMISFIIKKDWKRILWSGLVLAGCAAAVFMPYAASSEHWLAARTSVQLFSFVAGMAIIAILNTKKISAYIIDFAALALLAVILVYNNQITLDQIKTNQNDKAECDAIAQAIEQYENDTGIVVTGIAFCMDQQPTPAYPDVRLRWADLNLRVMTVDWARENAISFYLGRTLAHRGMATPPVFENRNWDQFNLSEQLYFEGETAYLCVY